MTLSIKLFHNRNGMGEEQYAYLEYDHTLKTAFVRTGHRIKKAATQEFIKHEEIHDSLLFIEEYPEWEEFVNDNVETLKTTAEERADMPDLSNLSDLTMDWEYEADNPLGRRKSARLGDEELGALFDNREIPVKLYSRQASTTGYLKDISEHGLAVMSYKKLPISQDLVVSFFLGQKKVSAQAQVKNSNFNNGKHRIGLEFQSLPQDDATYIVGLKSAKLDNRSNR
jgi:hypothetical protein